MKSSSGIAFAVGVLLLLVYVTMSWHFAEEEQHICRRHKKIHHRSDELKCFADHNNISSSAVAFKRHLH